MVADVLPWRTADRIQNAAGTISMDIAGWLRGLGLEQYEQAFRENDIDPQLLPELTADDLIGLGVGSIGHRRRLLAAIAALRPRELGPSDEPSKPPAVDTRRRQGAAERRQLTVMFSDLADSTALASRLDPEELGEVIGAYHRCVAEAVSRFDGFLAKYLGDGVLAYFGYPVAHEDDAERAVRAGLEVTRRVAALSGPGSPLNARVGIATGLVVVGEISRGEANAVVGETPNLAARLQAEAPPGGVVIAPATRRLTGDWFRYADLGARPLKGVAEPVPLTQVLDEQPAESRFAATRTALLTPFVGREQEIGLLLDRWRLASEGEGQVVVLSGEAGIGKSWISETLWERIAEARTRIRYQWPYYTDTPLFPVVTQLRAAARIEPDDPAATKLDKLEHVILPAAIGPEVALNLLPDLLAIPAGDRYPALTMGPELRKMRTLQVLADRLFALAQQRPVLVLLEDAHWIDPTTRELFDSVIEPIGHRRVMLLVTCRPEFQNPWGSHSHVTTLTLNRLGQRQCADLIGQLVGGRALPEGITDAIAARADGVPLFIEELTKSVLESGLLRDREGRLVADGPSRRWRSRPRCRVRCWRGLTACRPRARSRRSVRPSARSSTTNCWTRSQTFRKCGCMTRCRSLRPPPWCSAGQPARGGLHLQARAGAGRCTRESVEKPPSAAPCPYRRGDRSARSRGGVGPAATACTALRGSRVCRALGQGMACGGPPRGFAIGVGGGGDPVRPRHLRIAEHGNGSRA